MKTLYFEVTTQHKTDASKQDVVIQGSFPWSNRLTLRTAASTVHDIVWPVVQKMTDYEIRGVSVARDRMRLM